MFNQDTNVLAYEDFFCYHTLYNNGEEVGSGCHFELNPGLNEYDPTANMRRAGNANSGIKQDLNVSLHPNPAKNETYVDIMLPDASVVDIRLYDLLGKEIGEMATSRVFDVGLTRQIINLQSIVPGLYILQVRTDKGKRTIKLTVK